MKRLSKAPTWVIEAGVAYANDEWDGEDRVRIQERGERIVVEWLQIEGVDRTATETRGTSDMGGENVEQWEVEGTPEAFRKELADRKKD